MTMDLNKADPDTQTDIDIMILDYLLCIAIETALSGRIAERQGHQFQWDNDWCINSINTINSILPETYPLSEDINLKLQILRFTRHFLLRYTHDMLDERMTIRLQPSLNEYSEVNGEFSAIGDIISRIYSLSTDAMPPEAHENELNSNYLSMLHNLKIPPGNARSRRRLHPLLNITPEFIKLCAIASPKVSECCCSNITSQLIMQTIIEEIRIFGEPSPENLNARRVLGMPPSGELRWAQNCDTYINYLQPPPGVQPKIHIEDMSNKFPLFQFEGVVIDFLFNLMKKLDPPVLVQLERGKLRGMTGLETRQLKRRVGIA